MDKGKFMKRPDLDPYQKLILMVELNTWLPDEALESEIREILSEAVPKERVREVLSTLRPKRARVLTLRYGLEDGKTRTLEEVGREFSVTKERIRQLEEEGLRGLRHPTRSRRLFLVKKEGGQCG